MSVSGSQKYLKSKIRVGSIHSKLNYDRLERVFHSDDIPQRIKQRVQEINETKLNHDPQLFWRTSTFVLKDENEQTIPHKYTLDPQQTQSLLSETKNFTKSKVVDLKGTKTIQNNQSLNDLHFTSTPLKWGTTDTRDLFNYHQISCIERERAKWNDSTIFGASTFEQQKLKMSNPRILGNVHSANIGTKTRSKLNVKKYLNPTQREQQRMHLMRKYKDDRRLEQLELLQREKIEHRLARMHCKTTLKLKPFTLEDKENRNASITQKVDGTFTAEKLKEYLNSSENQSEGDLNADSSINQKLIELMMTKRNKMYTTRQLLKIQERRKYDIIRDYYHNGAFDNKMHGGGWSCCMNSNKHSQGCQVRLINTATWQTVGV